MLVTTTCESLLWVCQISDLSELVLGLNNNICGDFRVKDFGKDI